MPASLGSQMESQRPNGFERFASVNTCSVWIVFSATLGSMGQNVGGAIRWVGGIALVGALIMLILGQTVLEGRLRALGFLTYWVVCFLLLGVAVVSALRDFRGLQYRMRQEQRSLLDATLKKIEADAI